MRVCLPRSTNNVTFAHKIEIYINTKHSFIMKMRNLLALAAAIVGFATVSNAQETEKSYYPYPYMFVGVQGGVQNTFNNDYNNWKTFTPTASLSFGGYFNKFLGARLHFNGIWDKGSASTVIGNETKHFNYNYLTTNADALINLCTLFGKKDTYPVNVIFIAGLGANYAWDNSEALALTQNAPFCNINYAGNDKRWAFNGRVGVALDVPVHKNVSINLEADLNHIVPGDNQKFVTDNLQFLGQIGLNFRFGYKKKIIEKEIEYVTRLDTIWYDDSEFVSHVEDGKAAWNVFYQIRESDFTADEQLAAIGAFLADHRECKIDIKSYADVQTGNPRINMMYSKLRSEKAVKALMDAGVNESQITANYYGDTIQPFAENDKNRVSIITATGLKDVKDKKTVRKFRTKEVQVEVEK